MGAVYWFINQDNIVSFGFFKHLSLETVLMRCIFLDGEKEKLSFP